jgi:hypothetical protein
LKGRFFLEASKDRGQGSPSLKYTDPLQPPNRTKREAQEEHFLKKLKDVSMQTKSEGLNDG